VSGAPVAIGFLAGALSVLATADMMRGALARAQCRAPAAARSAAGVLEAFLAAGREGRDPGAADRRRMLVGGGLVIALVGDIVAGPLVGVAMGAGGPWVVSRALRARRDHYRRGVERETAALAVGLADWLAAGHSLRAALAGASRGLPGPAGHELRRVAGELAAGSPTDAALEAMRSRVRSPRLDTLVAACLVQRRAGGDLAGLLRECAEEFGDQARLEDEVKAATAQARFTGLVVVLLPIGGGLLAELASPGFIAGLWSSLLTAWLVGMAIGLQVAAAFLIRRLGRVRW
jgi:tight adherence protein B